MKLFIPWSRLFITISLQWARNQRRSESSTHTPIKVSLALTYSYFLLLAIHHRHYPGGWQQHILGGKSCLQSICNVIYDFHYEYACTSPISCSQKKMNSDCQHDLLGAFCLPHLTSVTCLLCLQEKNQITLRCRVFLCNLNCNFNKKKSLKQRKLQLLINMLHNFTHSVFYFLINQHICTRIVSCVHGEESFSKITWPPSSKFGLNYSSRFYSSNYIILVM